MASHIAMFLLQPAHKHTNAQSYNIEHRPNENKSTPHIHPIVCQETDKKKKKKPKE